ncbi:hypothetical protein DFH06DRAFT_1120371 [Mycena polygramma]|nr:hypothetical protein DFH06DRAFT_1120371 [Mycena polygramma]
MPCCTHTSPATLTPTLRAPNSLARSIKMEFIHQVLSLSLDRRYTEIEVMQLLDPLSSQLQGMFDDKVAASRAMGSLIKTVGKPLENVYKQTDADARLRLALIRCFIREKKLTRQNGHKARPFWAKFDEWIQKKRQELGNTFEAENWRRSNILLRSRFRINDGAPRFVEIVTKEDEQPAPPGSFSQVDNVGDGPGDTSSAPGGGCCEKLALSFILNV